MIPEQVTFIDWILLVCGTAILLTFLGWIPGRVARRRGHPQADAINAAGWLSVLTLCATSPVVLVWAFTRPTTPLSLSSMQEDIDDLWSQVKDLRTRVELMEQLDDLDARNEHQDSQS